MRLGFTLHWNGPPVPTQVNADHVHCGPFWQSIRVYHTRKPPFGRGWSSIAYSFGTCPHGIVFNGNGWNGRQFANGEDEVGADNGPDSVWYTIMAFLGEGQHVTHPMMGGITNLIHTGRVNGFCGSRITPHSWWKRKTCPGPELTRYAEMYDNQRLPIVGATQPEPEDLEMFIADCQGRPALLVDGGYARPINVGQRNALRSCGVPKQLVTPEVSDDLASLGRPPK